MIYAEMAGKKCRIPQIHSDGPMLPNTERADVWFLDLTGLPTPQTGQIWNGATWDDAAGDIEHIWVSELEFYRLFGLQIFIDIEKAAETHPPIRVFLKMLQAAGGCYLNHPETLAGINYLVSQSILTAEQAEKIISGIGL